MTLTAAIVLYDWRRSASAEAEMRSVRSNMVRAYGEVTSSKSGASACCTR